MAAEPGPATEVSDTPPPQAPRRREWWMALGCAGVLLVGLVAIAVPNLLNAIQHGKTKRTMSDLRTIGNAVESYQVDHGIVPRIASGPVESLRPVLQPKYVKLLPVVDAWHHPFQFEADGDLYSLVSLGRDGAVSKRVPGAYPARAWDSDIVFSNGQFTVWQESAG